MNRWPTLPGLPEGYGWTTYAFSVDMYKTAWEIQLVKVTRPRKHWWQNDKFEVISSARFWGAECPEGQILSWANQQLDLLLSDEA